MIKPDSYFQWLLCKINASSGMNNQNTTKNNKNKNQSYMGIQRSNGRQALPI